MQKAWSEIDAELSELGELPVNLAALIARHTPAELDLPQVDSLLAELGGELPLPTGSSDTEPEPEPEPAPAPEPQPKARKLFPWESDPPPALEAEATEESAHLPHDAVEHVVGQATQAPAEPAYELEGQPQDTEPSTEAASLAADEGGSGADAADTSSAEGDEFEIMVDDEILEISDDDMVIEESDSGE